MTDPSQPTSLDPQAAALAERLEAAVVEATRDLKGYYMRETRAQIAQIEERHEKRIADIEAELRGVNVKLVAMRNELHQSLRDQVLKLAAMVGGIVAFGIAAALLATRRWG